MTNPGSDAARRNGIRRLARGSVRRVYGAGLALRWGEGRLRSLQAANVAHERNATSFGYAYRRLRAGLDGKRPKELGPVQTVAPTQEQSWQDHADARGLYWRAALAEQLMAGEPLEDATTSFVRGLIASGDHLAGRSISQALLTHPNTKVAGHIGSALVAAQMSLPNLAWSHFAELPADLWRRLAPLEFLRTAFRVDRSVAVVALRELVSDAPAYIKPATWVELVKAAFGAKEEQLAEEVFELADALAQKAPEEWSDTAVERDWLRPWFDQVLRPSAPPSIPEGHISFAILDYKQPDRSQASTNLGDYMQTLASLGHLVRHQKISFRGDPDVAGLLTKLQARVSPELRLGTATRGVTVVKAHRDASTYDAIPPITWAIAFGWYMQKIFDRYDFPLHPNLRPIFISFHCNRPEMLSSEAIEYLKTYGPVGCRDWTTVDLLLSAGVPAFFSGCITTTTNTVFPDLNETSQRKLPVAYVDAKAPRGAPTITQACEEVRNTDLVPNLLDAIQLLETYRRDYSGVVTTRLHCYLPSRSVGVPVQFRPTNLADIRFNGILDLSDAEYARMQRGLLAKLEAVLTAILTGTPEDKVYLLWRELCAADVAQAEARRVSSPQIAPPSFDLTAACSVARIHQVMIPRSAPAPDGDEVHVALGLDGNLKDELKIVIQAMIDNCSRPLHLWIMCRDHRQKDFEGFAALFPEVTATWLPCDDIDYGPVLGMLRHITVSTMDRLLLPELLPELDRIVYHDIDALPLGDIAELYDWDLQGQPIAARSAVAAHVVSGFSNIMRSAKRLREDPTASHNLIRSMHARHAYDFRSFNAGILVLDLKRMREDEFCLNFLPFVERYGMNDQEILNCYAGPNRAVLPPAWNSLPTQEVVIEPKIIHWAGPLKPWKREYVLLRERWQEYERRLRRRTAGIREGVKRW